MVYQESESQSSDAASKINITDYVQYITYIVYTSFLVKAYFMS